MNGLTRETLKSRHDGFALGAARAPATGQKLGGVVVIQEIFGVTPHIEQMCAAFAAAGYEALAPSFYDRVEKDFRAGHDTDGIRKGVEAVAQSPWEQVAGDVQAAIDALPKPVFVTGFCWGGAASWAAAARCEGLRAASCFYGRLIVSNLDRKPTIPVMLHYGARDGSIPQADVERVRAAMPDAPLYIYDAGHGFCREGSHDYNADACNLAMARTLEWFARWRPGS